MHAHHSSPSKHIHVVHKLQSNPGNTTDNPLFSSSMSDLSLTWLTNILTSNNNTLLVECNNTAPRQVSSFHLCNHNFIAPCRAAFCRRDKHQNEILRILSLYLVSIITSPHTYYSIVKNKSLCMHVPTGH